MCNLKEIIENLSNNIMFRLSLGSKELFHSNYLAWIFETYPKETASIFNIDIPQQIDNEHIIEREKCIGKNSNKKKCIADIYIKNNNTEIIIENKFKTQPDEDQLNDYLNNSSAKIILLSYFEPIFNYKEKNIKHWSYQFLKDGLEKLLNTINNKEHKIFINNYIEMLSMLLKLKDLLTLKGNNKKYIELYTEISQVKNIADKINLYKFIQKIFFIQLGIDLKNDINNIDWINCDVSRNQQIFLDLMVECENKSYKNESIKALGITISENEETIRHHIGIGRKEKTEQRCDIENRLINNKSSVNKLLDWFFNDCIGKKDNKFWGFDCLKENNPDCWCWLFKKTNKNFINLNYKEMCTLIKSEINNICINIK